MDTGSSKVQKDPLIIFYGVHRYFWKPQIKKVFFSGQSTKAKAKAKPPSRLNGQKNGYKKTLKKKKFLS